MEFQNLEASVWHMLIYCYISFHQTGSFKTNCEDNQHFAPLLTTEVYFIHVATFSQIGYVRNLWKKETKDARKI